MKTTQYFQFMRKRPDRNAIKKEWIAQVIKSPIREEIQHDGRVRRWAKIIEANGKYLRVILPEDKETVHNVFFDGNFKERSS